MSSRYTEFYTCPTCKTYFRAVMTTGIQPCKTEEPIYCPVCWDKVGHVNITGDVDCLIESLDNTIEPYKSKYLKAKAMRNEIEELITQILSVNPEGRPRSVIIRTVKIHVNGANVENIQSVLSEMLAEGKLTTKPINFTDGEVPDGDIIYALSK